MDITFNFIGMCVADWKAAYTFFTQTLGLDAELNPAHGDWANLGGAWAGYYSDTHSLVCELFDAGQGVADRWWGKNQNIRPAIHVANLAATVAQLQARNVQFTSAVEQQSWGKQIEFTTVEGIRWGLAEWHDKPVRPDFRQPQFGHVALKTANFAAQQQFYTQMGFLLEATDHDRIIFTQTKPHHPFIMLEKSGEFIATDAYRARHPERSFPFFLSFMTPDIQSVAQECAALHIPTLRPVAHYEDWGGTDMVILDADGNAIQIVQYD
jgi:catechol 2,3-dioxygenase-like lactoylglutathione lyase family enzyme